MLDNSKSSKNSSKKINDNSLLKSNNSTPILPTIKTKFQDTIKTPLNEKVETNNTSNIYKKNYIEKLSQPSSITPKKIMFDYFSHHKKIKISKIKSKIKKSASSEMIKPRSIPNIRVFHQHLMLQNQKSCNKSLIEGYKKYEIEKRDLKEINEILNSLDENKKMKTGIYGPSDNIVSVIRARMERLKYDNFYKGVEPVLKEIIKDEIMDAEVRLKRKPEVLCKKKFNIRPLYLKRLDQYKYLSSMNTIREINQLQSTPVIVKDGPIMIKLINDAFSIYRVKK